jgi:hypothetical protein
VEVAVTPRAARLQPPPWRVEGTVNARQRVLLARRKLRAQLLLEVRAGRPRLAAPAAARSVAWRAIRRARRRRCSCGRAGLQQGGRRRASVEGRHAQVWLTALGTAVDRRAASHGGHLA